ncbi:glucose-1-phosphate thymidylyltransferase RfbA [Nocardiopsis sp. MG754419]|uniref:glucose-1-phosphate thymidylyltransferase RfbA n=1 Tax=Nocardiopsis sp. MG754419 TaxID=2259865 RepID=UPI001BAD79C1|nr:glucose-1-phosphate thymidylyltransferase RfbA [Nocardiopsis sp. MG754419]MBR8745255.1 glucose-1-phosphate thymidylyltransferase [Nocardiopsis sp. MG754419]
MKGILLAGGRGSRLHPITVGVSKQLLPIYNKPMVYYPLSVLMLAGIRDVLIICSPHSMEGMRTLLGDGSHLGMNITYALQEEPRGIADAYRIGADHVAGESSALVLGDNIFHGSGFQDLLARTVENLDGCTLFGYPVTDPERYGVANVDAAGRLIGVEEKPRSPQSSNAITGLYFYDPDVVEIARDLAPSARGELEITDVNQRYVDEGRADLVELGRGFAWLDAGTYSSLLEAGHFVRTLANRQGVHVACLEEIALRLGYITAEECHRMGSEMRHSDYGEYLVQVALSLADTPTGAQS